MFYIRDISEIRYAQHSGGLDSIYTSLSDIPHNKRLGSKIFIDAYDMRHFWPDLLTYSCSASKVMSIYTLTHVTIIFITAEKTRFYFPNIFPMVNCAPNIFLW
jgi:hypothetical protein